MFFKRCIYDTLRFKIII